MVNESQCGLETPVLTDVLLMLTTKAKICKCRASISDQLKSILLVAL